MFEVRWSVMPDLWIRLLVLERVVDLSVSTILVLDMSDWRTFGFHIYLFKNFSGEESLVERV